MEKHILALETSGMYDVNSESDSLEDKALELAIEEVYQANDQKWRPWAKNARSIRIGEIILIVDSDTIVPEVNPYKLFSINHVVHRSIRTVSEMLRES